jgi:PDZ domain-containing protein
VTRRTVTLLVTAFLVAVLVALGMALPVPYVADEPGPVSDVLGSVNGKPLISVAGRPAAAKPSGRLFLTTVSQDSELTLFEAVVGYLSHQRAVVPEEVLKSPGQSQADLQREFQREMVESQQDAISAALHEQGVPATVTVTDVDPTSPAFGKLAKGDVLQAVDGQKIQDEVDLRAKINRAAAGKPVAITYQRGKAPPATVSIVPKAVTDAGGSRKAIGVIPDNQWPVKVDVQNVSIDGQPVGGPSAGLMLALGILDVYNGNQLVNGTTVAGTGTISDDGQVGPIGGVQQKLVGARRNGAQVFLVPAGNCAEAQHAIPSGLRLVKVDTLHQAAGVLREIAAGKTDQPSC